MLLQVLFLYTVVDCGPITNLTSGQVNTSKGTTFGSVVTFSCNAGYMLSHQQVVICGADGVWSPDIHCLGEKVDYSGRLLYWLHALMFV